MHDGQWSDQRIESDGVVAEVARRHENAIKRGPVGKDADTCTAMPFINQNKPCNLPDYSGTKHHHL
jgi:hypothetical protein